MKQIGILHNTRSAAAPQLAEEIGVWLEERETACRSGTIQEWAGWEAEIAALDLLIVLGGDGTTLFAGRLAAPYDVPIFGINLGRVGFLSEAEPAEWQQKLSQVLQNDYWVEKRLMLEATLWRGEEILGSLVALNEIVVSRGAPVKLIRCHLSVDGDRVLTYSADGLIVATPTGSTAYSMAVGGPLLPPRLHNVLVMPVAPHLSFERALVLHQEALITIEIETGYDAVVTADGQNALTLENGDRVQITRFRHDSHFARVSRPAYFYRRLMQKLNYWSLSQEVTV